MWEQIKDKLQDSTFSLNKTIMRFQIRDRKCDYFPLSRAPNKTVVDPFLQEDRKKIQPLPNLLTMLTAEREIRKIQYFIKENNKQQQIAFGS